VGLTGEQALNDLRIEHGSAACNLVQRPRQLVQVAHPLLEQIPQSCNTVAQQLERVILLGVLREHHNTDAWILGPDPFGRDDVLVGYA
jgi:hypothetical protein